MHTVVKISLCMAACDIDVCRKYMYVCHIYTCMSKIYTCMHDIHLQKSNYNAIIVFWREITVWSN